jgi:hypothetical protein
MHRSVTSPLVVAALALVATAADQTRAAYMITPLSGGTSQRTLAWGQTLTLDIVLTSNTAPADTHTSALFQVRFTRAGLSLTSMTWAQPYQTGGLNDFSLPAAAELPVAIVPATLEGGLYPQNLSDIEMGNALIGASFSTGTLVSLTIAIPSNYGYEGPIFISLNPDEFASGFNPVSTTAGQVFRLDVVVPAPSAVIAAASFAAVASLRRRRTA